MDCPTCGKKLQRIPWNSVVDVLVCDNIHCTMFKKPMPIPVGEKTPESHHDLDEQMKEVRREESLSKKLQRLRRIIYSEDK